MTQNTIYTSSTVETTEIAAIPPIDIASSHSGYSGSRGQPGYSGSRGGAGYAGSRGTAGAAGATGYAGSRGAGYAGSRGNAGYAGSAGIKGYTGSVGAGYAGSRGNVGYAGSTGIGIKGYTGSAGAGYTGSKSAGYTGSTGIGIKGYTGSVGAGYAGSRGNVGYAGSAGAGGGGGGGGYTRTTASAYAVLSNAASASLNITGFKSYTLYRIQTSVAAWVRLYSNAAARSADLNRISTVDPSFDAGVLAEVITTASGKTVYFTPAVAGYNTESTVTRNIPITVTNKSGASANVIVTLTLLQTEA